MANNNIKGRSYQKSKEGFSLFTLLDRTRSKAGRERFLMDASSEFVDGVVFVESDFGMALVEVGMG